MGYKTKPAGRYFKMYINVGKFYSKRNQKWLTAGNAAHGGAITYYSDAVTQFLIPTGGMADNEIIANVKVTWYVKFKGFTGS